MSCVLQLMLLLLLCVGVRGGEECPDNWVVDYDSGSTCVPCNAGNTRKGEGGTCKSCAFYEVTPNRGDNYCHSFDYNNCEARVSGACNCPNTDCRTSECRWPSAPLYYTYDGDPEYITRIEVRATLPQPTHTHTTKCLFASLSLLSSIPSSIISYQPPPLSLPPHHTPSPSLHRVRLYARTPHIMGSWVVTSVQGSGWAWYP